LKSVVAVVLVTAALALPARALGQVGSSSLAPSSPLIQFEAR